MSLRRNEKVLYTGTMDISAFDNRALPYTWFAPPVVLTADGDEGFYLDGYKISWHHEAYVRDHILRIDDLTFLEKEVYNVNVR